MDRNIPPPVVTHRSTTSNNPVAAGGGKISTTLKAQQKIQMLQSVIAQTQERVLDEEMYQCDQMLHNDDMILKLRQQRIQQMQEMAQQQTKYKMAQHGTYEELTGTKGTTSHDVGRAFFDCAKQSERFIVHFYRPQTEYCQIFHKHLSTLAVQHMETKFVKVNVQDCDQMEQGASFLVERLQVRVMPTLVLICKGKVVHQIRGFDELGGTESFETFQLAQLLAKYLLVHLTDKEQEQIQEEIVQRESRRRNNGRGSHTSHFLSSSNGHTRRGRDYREEDDEEDF